MVDQIIDKLKEEWRSMGISESEILEKEKVINEISKDKPVCIEISEIERNMAIEYIKKKKSYLRSTLIMSCVALVSSFFWVRWLIGRVGILNTA